MEEEKKTEETAAAENAGGSILQSAAIKWVIVGVILLVFIGIMIGISMFAVGKITASRLGESAPKQDEEEQQEKLKKQVEMGATLAAPIEVTVNIFEEEGRYLKCGVQLEYDAADVKLGQELESRKVRIKDVILGIMSNQPLSRLSSNEGKMAIKEQIVAEINGSLPKELEGKPLGEVKRSYFESFVIQ
ncbi:MAG: flagellar basal body-associated FliL family protein [Fibromonadales bacterium]|nr:flagellar basal body-associated FliL family protein [Fibromonadales bacterium]